MSNHKNCSGANNKGTGAGIILFSKKPFLLPACLLALLAACSTDMDEFREKSAAVDAVNSENYRGLHADTISGTTFNFIRSADMKLQVGNVLSCTNLIEDATRKAGGYLAKSELQTETVSNSSVRCRKDSILETRMYVTKNHLTIRVPAALFDTTLRQITGLAVFLDYRTQKADNVKAKLFAGAAHQKEYLDFSGNVRKKSEASSRLPDVVKAQESALEKSLLANEKEVESYNLYEQVNYSIINVELYQTVQLSRMMSAAMPEIEPYETPYHLQLVEALDGGLIIFKKILLFLTWAWGVWLPAIIIFFLVKRFQGLKARKQSLS